MAHKVQVKRIQRRGTQAGTMAALDMLSFIMHLVLNFMFYVFVIFLVYRASVFVYDFCYQVFGDVVVEEAPGVNVEIDIPEGTSTMELASKLEMNRLVVNRYSFYLKVKLLGYKILAGTYHLNTSMTYDDIINTITNYANAIEPPNGDKK
ncbi:MAG: endolytic transglycosylase MltG [Lachnospiraceae bacterium]|nr:endolytic transglycosylase MltG [Lachnospiraceae bacterium]